MCYVEFSRWNFLKKGVCASCQWMTGALWILTTPKTCLLALLKNNLTTIKEHKNLNECVHAYRFRIIYTTLITFSNLENLIARSIIKSGQFYI